MDKGRNEQDLQRPATTVVNDDSCDLAAGVHGRTAAIPFWPAGTLRFYRRPYLAHLMRYKIKKLKLFMRLHY